MDLDVLSRIFKALSDPNRLFIIGLISGSELCACKILETLDITQPTLSYHMRVLSDAGLVNIRQDGKWSHYSVSTDAVGSVQRYLRTIGKG